MTLMNDEKRSSERIVTNLPARWHGVSGVHEGRIEDISPNGCFVNTKGAVDVGEMITVLIQLPSDAWLSLRGRVVFFHQMIGFSMSFDLDGEKLPEQLNDFIAAQKSATIVTMLDPTKRFSNRVENYLKYRPRYPREIIPLLKKDCSLTRHALIADIGSGTGFLAELFLQNGNRVIGVEPNAEMRAAGEQMLAQYEDFTSVEATAENTTLPDSSVDFVTAGQAFHWFDREQTRPEFARILKPDGWVVIVWNGYKPERTPLLKGYHEVLLRYGTDYRDVRREIESTELDKLFAVGEYKVAQFEFQQRFDFEGFKGRILSASYAPQPGEPNYEPMLNELREVFESNQKDGTVVFDYDTEVYYGRIHNREP
jgi:SAM-dependent methyltransferase